MKSPPSLKTYAQRRKARTVSTPARMEEMERMIHNMTSGQRTQCARNFPTIRLAIKAIEEVGVDFPFFLPSKSQTEALPVLQGDGYRDQHPSCSPFHASLCICTDVAFFQSSLEVTQIPAISAVYCPLIHSCMLSFSLNVQYFESLFPTAWIVGTFSVTLVSQPI
jgi:hypothetical protein